SRRDRRMAVFLYAPIMLQCMSPLVMLCTAPSPARECHESGCCLLQRMSPSLAHRVISLRCKIWSLLGNSGQRRLLACDALSVFDPSATLDVHRGNSFDAGFSPYQSTRLSLYNASSRRRGEHATAEISWRSRWCGSGMAARRECATAGPRATDRRAYGVRRER